MSDNKPFQEDKRFTKIHNYVFDSLMPVLSPNAFKALMFIIRNTRGMTDEHGNRVKIARLSYPTIKTGTGIKHNTTLSDALKELKFFDLITVEVGKDYEANSYAINEEHEAKSESDLGTTKSKYDLWRKSENDVPPTSENDGNNKEKKDLKKNDKRKTTNHIAANDTPPPPPPPEKAKGIRKEPTAHQAIVDAYVSELGYNPPTSAGGAMGKAAKWLATNGYTPEQVSACYRHLKAQGFYADKFLALATVQRELPEYLRHASEYKATAEAVDDCLKALSGVNGAIKKERLGNPIAQPERVARQLAERGETFATVRKAWLECKNGRKPVGAFVVWIRDGQSPLPQQTETKVYYDDLGNKFELVDNIGWQRVSA